MKKLLSLLLTLSLILTFTACDTTGEPDETTAADEAVTEVTTAEETTSPPPTTTAPHPMPFVQNAEYMYEVEEEVVFLVFGAAPYHYAFHRNGIVTYIHTDAATWRDDYKDHGLIDYYAYGYDEAGTYWVEGHDTLHVNISGQTYKWKLLRNENIETTGTTIGELIYYGMHSFEDGSGWSLPGHPDYEDYEMHAYDDDFGLPGDPDEPQPITVNVGDIIQLGGYDWRVLDVQGDRALILTDRVIDNRAYHRQVDAITWADSDIRKWLNGDFYNSFNSTDRARIRQTTVINADNGPTPGGVNTTDYIFLLSVDEANKYSAGIALNSGNMSDIWWLRSPADYGYTGGAAFANYFGEVIKGGSTHMTHVGIRPAMWITL